LAPKSDRIRPANGAGASPAISNTLIFDNGRVIFDEEKRKYKRKISLTALFMPAGQQKVAQVRFNDVQTKKKNKKKK
jgi:hypothetical protein